VPHFASPLNRDPQCLIIAYRETKIAFDRKAFKSSTTQLKRASFCAHQTDQIVHLRLAFCLR